MPATGPVYLDSCGFIYSVERVEPYRTLLETMWRQAQSGQFFIATSELAVMETLVKPLQEGDTALETLFRQIFDSREVRLIPATRPLWEETARLRATTNLRTPDALHAATALLQGCTLFITNDRAFQRVPELSVAVLKDFL